jgi:biopolymer transport protein ExbB/TolQ
MVMASEVTEEGTPLAQWFNDEMVQNILTYILSIAGTVTALLIVIRKILAFINKLKALFETAKAKVEESDLLSQKAKEEANNYALLFEKGLAWLEGTGKKLESGLEEISKMKEELKADNGQALIKLNQILDVLQIAFTNDVDLVKRGFADEIKMVRENETNQK